MSCDLEPFRVGRFDGRLQLGTRDMVIGLKACRALCRPELDRRPGILWTQRSLASACRYLYLHGQFDNVFWAAMLDNGQAPVEAEGLTRRFDSDSVFFE